MPNLYDANKPFCLIKRREDNEVLYLSGEIQQLDYLDQIPRKSGAPPLYPMHLKELGRRQLDETPEHSYSYVRMSNPVDNTPRTSKAKDIFDTLSILPFYQVKELGFVARHQDEKIICLKVDTQRWLAIDECIGTLPTESVTLESTGVFSPDDAGYASRVQQIIDAEINQGAGCNFVVPRRFRARIANFSLPKALSIFRRLLTHEYGVYWTFLFYTGNQYFIGATPERHISYRKGVVKMNPISGTLRKNEYSRETIQTALQNFLKDPKEIFELLMVTDEELKMIADICSEGGQIVGPMLKEMSQLTHSEYVLTGQSHLDIIDMLRKSMFAATVTGSPIENACRVIYRHDPESRRYYGSALALIGRDDTGQDTLDSPITIRMAEIDLAGNLEIGVGGSLVRNSIPAEEVAETHAKAGALLNALGLQGAGKTPTYQLGENLYSEDVMIALSARNTRLSRFWLDDRSQQYVGKKKPLIGKKIAIVDHEDNFTHMMAYMIRALGADVHIVLHDQYQIETCDADIVILGPGPGDPRDLTDPKMARLSALCRTFLAIPDGFEVLGRRRFDEATEHSSILCEEGESDRQHTQNFKDDGYIQKPLLCVCLGHQMLCQTLNLPIAQKENASQGVQALINLWGEMEYVGFYNAFVGKITPQDDANKSFDVSCDPQTGEIHALKSGQVVGIQFHPESLLTTNGFRIVRDILQHLLGVVVQT